MRLSIVVPVLNEAEGIEGFLHQFDAARRDGHEVIVVDGGSDDETVLRARPWCDVLLASAPGRAQQMQIGVNAASGDALWFVHADTLLRPGTFRSVVAALGRERRTWGRFNVRLSGRHWMFRVIERMINLRSRLSGIATGDQAMFVVRSALARVGGIPAQALLEDVELSKRLKREGRAICLTEKLTTSSRRWETHGIWRTIVLMWGLRFRYFLGADPERLRGQYYGGC